MLYRSSFHCRGKAPYGKFSLLDIHFIGCINRFVSVTTSNFTLIYQFLSNQSSAEKTCSVEYRVCGQEQVFTSEGNSTLDALDRVILQLSLLNGSDCYSYNATASDGVSTVIVQGEITPGEFITVLLLKIMFDQGFLLSFCS